MDHSVPKTDGYAIRAKYLLEAQVASGHEVVVVTSPSQGDSARDESVAGVHYYRSHYSSAERKVVEHGGKHLVFGRPIARRVAERLRTGKFDVVHAHTPFTVARVGLRMARRNGLPFVYEKRNLWEESARARGKPSGRWPAYQLARAMDRWVTQRADAVCTITQALKAHTIQLGADPKRVFVVGNGVDVDSFAPRPASSELRRRCLADGNFVIGFIGSFFSFEGLPLLVEAFARVRASFPGARLVLVGDGEDAAAVDRLVRSRGLDKYVWLAGRVPHDQVIEFYAAMDVLAYPRYHSTLTDMISPLKPLEPMAMARCVVASNVGGLRELVVDGETGLLFRAGSPEDLAAKLELLLSGSVPASRLGDEARRQVVAKRQWRHMAQAYDVAYGQAQARVQS